MRAYVVRELRDLAPFCVPLAAAAGLFGAFWEDLPQFQTGVLVVVGALCGAVVGAVQGFRDRGVRSDAFLLHRPVTPVVIHAGRTVAGAAATAGVALVLVGLRAAFPVYPAPGAFELVAGAYEPARPGSVSPGDVAATTAAALVLWASVRLAVARPRAAAAGLLVITLPPLVVLRLLSQGGGAPPAAGAIVAATALAVVAVFDLAHRPEAAR